MKFSEGVFLLTLMYPNGQGRAHSRVKTKSGGMYSAATRRDPHLPHHRPTSMGTPIHLSRAASPLRQQCHLCSSYSVPASACAIFSSSQAGPWGQMKMDTFSPVDPCFIS